MELSHTNQQGKAQMVDISAKSTTERIAIAEGCLSMAPATLKKIKENTLKKGDVLAVARLAGILAAKKTDELIPLCHTLPLSDITVDFEEVDERTLKIKTSAKTNYQTGVEMEALTAVSVAALTIYDMVKAVDKAVLIKEIHLVHKEGGKSGSFDWGQ
ncbi:MAG: cyclic pyranopterin monophosphate synthase MoaC [Anaerolineaceae bacterium]|nr:cyclic pyranopterin monophosphate synthase MoaC [Anaerolineaceae bacterium]